MIFFNKRFISAFIAIVILLLWMVSCSPSKRANRKLKRAAKLIERAKELNPSVSTIDTVIVADTVYIEAVRVDTTFVDKGDTITIENERLLIRYKRDTITNEVFIEGECKADTIYQTIKVPCEKLIVTETWLEKLGIKVKWYHEVLFWLVVVIGLLLFLWSRFKPI